MSGRGPKIETRGIDLSGAIGLAGELHRLVAGCMEVAPCRIEPPVPNKLTPAAAGVLGAESFDGWLLSGRWAGSKKTFQPAGFTCPEIFEPLERAVIQAVGETKALIADLTGARIRAKERLKSHNGAPRKHAAGIRVSLENLNRRLVRNRERLGRLNQAGRDLARAREIWRQLATSFAAWPKTAQGLNGQLPDPADEWKKTRRDRTAIGSQLEESCLACRKIDQKCREITIEIEGLLDRAGEYDANVGDFSRILDEKTADLKRAPQSPRHRFEQVSSRIKALYEERSLLTNRRDALIERMTKLLAVRDSLIRKEARYRSDHEALVRQAIASIRSMATHRGALIRRCGRLEDQLAQAWSGLVPLIGRSKALESGLVKTALNLSRIREKLDAAKKNLARAHDDFISVPEAMTQPRPTRERNLEKTLDRLKQLKPGGEIAGRLPRQLSSYRAALIRYTQIKDLVKVRGEQAVEIERLEGKNGRLLGLLADSKDRMASLAREKTRLLSELDAAGQQADGLAVHLEDELYPLMNALSLALYRNQVRTSEIESEKAAGAKKAAELSALASELDARRKNAAETGLKMGQALILLGEDKFRLEQENFNLKRDKDAAVDVSLKVSQALAVLGRDSIAKDERLVRERSRYDEAFESLKAEGRRKETEYRDRIDELTERSVLLEKEKQSAVGSFVNLGLAVNAEMSFRERQHKQEKEHLTVRLDAAEKEADALTAEIKKIEADHQIETAAHKKQISALNVKAAQLDTGKRNAEEKTRELELALGRLEEEALDRQARFQTRRNKLYALAKAWKVKAETLKTEVETLESRYNESRELARRQDHEIRVQKDQEAEMLELLTFFMEQVNLWAHPPQKEEPAVPLPEGAEVLALMIHMLRQENENLNEAVGVLQEDRRSLFLENEHLARSHQAMKARLTELLPVFDFFYQSWFSTTAALTAQHADRMAAVEELNRLKHQARVQGARLLKLSSRLDAAERDLESAHSQIGRLDDENAEARRLGAEFKSLFEEAECEVEKLTAVRIEMAKTIELQHSDLTSLTSRQETLLVENKTLAGERAAWRKKAHSLSRQATTLSKNLADRQGQAESAWAAAALLGTRSKEALACLQSELTAQAETIHALEMRLDEKSGRIIDLERNQDRLGLLFWLISQHGGQNGRVAASLMDLSGENAFKEAALTAGIRLQAMTSTAWRHFKNDRFQDAARKAVRRGFYSMVLACGLVMAAPQESSKATAYPRGLNLTPQAGLIDIGPPQLESAAKGPIYSPYLDRKCDISFIDPWERSKGVDYIQELIRGRIDLLASEAGLDQNRFVQLVQRFFDPGEIISVARLQETSQTFDMLRNYFPGISEDFNRKAPRPEDVATLVRLAGLVNILECGVWDRLYRDFRNLGAGPQKALGMMLGNIRPAMETRGNHRVEFAGRLRPIPELETLGLEDFIKVVTPYFKANIKAIVARPAYAYAHKPEDIDEYARKLACDMYVAGKTFGVPRTMMVSIAHQESYFANILGDNSLSAGPFQIYQPTKPYIIRNMAQKGLMVPAVPDHLQDHVTLATYMAAFFMSSLIEKHSKHWRKDRAPLCDLDRVALSYNGGKSYPGEVYKKKIALLGYLDRYRRIALKKKEADRQG